MRKRPDVQHPRSPRLTPLTRLGRWAVRSCLVVPLLFFLTASVLYCVRLGRLLLANLSPIAAAEITRQTGHETLLGAVRLRPWGTLVVDNIAVSSRRTFAESHGESILRTDRLTIHYDLRKLIFDSGNAVQALGDVRLDRPTLLVERITGKTFNFTDIFQPLQRPHPRPFIGQIIVRDGTLHFRDYSAPANLGARPAYNTLAHVNATVNLHSTRTVYFVADGSGTGGRLRTILVSGDSSRVVVGRFRVAATVNDADAAYWAAYFAASSRARVIAGRADLNLTVARLYSLPSPGSPVDILGTAAVRHGQLSLGDPALRRLAVRDIMLGVTFTGGGAAFRGTTAVNGQFIQADGTVSDFAHPELAVNASAPALDAEALARAIPGARWPTGLRLARGAAVVSVVGPAAQPTVNGTVAVPALDYAGNRLTALRASGVFTGRTLSVPGLTFRTPGGGAAGLHGTLALGKTLQARIAGQAADLNLSALRLPGAARTPLGGRMNAQFLADNVGHPLRLVADVVIARPRISRSQLLSARARLVYVQGQGLTVSRALVRAPQGAALAAGTIPVGGSGHWNIRLDAAGLSLASLVGPYTSAPVGGLAYFQGQIGGPSAAPQVAGQLQLLNPRYARFSADIVRGGLTASADGLRLDDLALDRFPTDASVTGTVTRLATRDPALDLHVHVSQADVQDFLDLAAQFSTAKDAAATAALPPLTGTAGGTFLIGGTVRDPRVAGSADVTDATVGPYRVDGLHVRASYGAGIVRVADATLRGEGATLQTHGTLGVRTGGVHAVYDVHGLDLDRLRSLIDPYADVHGVLTASGTVGGRLKSPTATASVSFTGLSVNGQALSSVTLAGRYADGEIVKTDTPSTLDFLPSSATGHDIRYVIRGLRLFLPTPQHTRRVPAIALDAAIPVTAPETVSHLIQTLRDSRQSSTPAVTRLLDQLDALPQPLDGTIALPTLHVHGPLASPNVQTAFQLSDLSLGAYRLGSLSGHASFADPKDPSAALDLTASDLFAAGVSVSSLTARASLEHHVFSLTNLSAVSQRAYLAASGRADLRPGGDLQADLDASNIPLSLLDSLVPQPATERRTLTGEVGSLTISASGPTVAPNLTASISLTDPGLAIGSPSKPPRVTYALERVRSGALTLTTPTPGGGQVLTLTDLAAFQNGRPIASLSGSLPFQWHGRSSALPAMPDGQPLHAQLVVQDLSQLAPFAPGLDPKRTAGAVTANLDVMDTGARRHLTGSLDLTGGSVGMLGFDTALSKIEAHLTLAGDRVKIGRLSAVSTKGGVLAVSSGSGLSLSQADLRVAAEGLTVDESSRQNLLSQIYGAAFRGKINGAVDISGPWLTPLVSTPSGAPLIISDAAGTIPAAPAATGVAAAPSPFDPRLDLTVDLGGANHTISVSNVLLRADAGGDVRLTGSLAAPDLRAHLAIARGQILLPPATRLKFVRSQTGNNVDIRYPSPVPDANGQPQLQTVVDLTAQANVSLSQAQLATYRSDVPQIGAAQPAPLLGNTASAATSFDQPQTYTITAHVHGVLNDPNLQIDLSSSPGGLSRQEMLAGLSGVAGLQGLNSQVALQSELASALTSTASSVLLTPLEDSVAYSLGLTDFDVAYSPDAPVLVTLGKQLLPRLEVTYQRFLGTRTGGATAIGQPAQYTLKLSYGLTRRLQISVSTDDQYNDTVALEDVEGF